MEAALTLPISGVSLRGERVLLERLEVDDPALAGLVRERIDAGEDAVKVVLDALAIGARVLDREQAGANAEFVRTEFERAARELNGEVSERVQGLAERLDAKVEEAFGKENGQLTKLLGRHFSDESAVAVQNRVKTLVGEAASQMLVDLRRQFSADAEDNPVAAFQRQTVDAVRTASAQQVTQLSDMGAKLEAMNIEITKLRAEREKLEEIAAVEEKGTAKGRAYEELVFDAIDQIASAQGDDAEAVGDRSEASGKKGDVVVGIEGCNGPPLGRIVFEAKDRKLSKPDALRELDGAMAERGAEFAVLVVRGEDKVPAKLQTLREYNGDKLVVPFDPDEGPLALRVGYALARARVLMRRGGADGVDVSAVQASVERAIGAMAEVQRIKQQLTGAKTSIDKAAEIVESMSGTVRVHLAEIDTLLKPAE